MSSQTDYVWETKNEEMFKYFEARRTKVFYSQIRAMGHGDVSVEAAIPCPTQADGWPRAQQERYRRLVAACDYETLVQSSYSPGCMQRRNRYMVDHAALLLAVHNGQPGGTRRTMEYAMRRGLQIVDIPPVMEP